MRILKIAGQNIASLAEPFCIDLTAEPLRSAGLFAITGQTGAGKSSILDAMCLALYGDAPRLSSGSRQDEVPDAGGEPIKAQDPRAILRRGAHHGWAAVTFTGIDDQAYEARWTARRARDRADGRLQGVARQIARVSDGQVLASQLSQVTDQVQALTGLSYDEFRRTVLLAQGDFDAFLRAESNDRAALLEKVTGTGMYRAISTSVYDRTAEAQAALTLLVHERDAHHLLPDAARLALQTERVTLIAGNDTARAERLTLEAELARHRRLTEAARRLHDAGLALTAADLAAKAAEPGRRHLANIDRAEPLRLPHESLRQAGAAQARAAETLVHARAALSLAQGARTVNHDAATAAADRHAHTEALFKTLGPQWTEATQLDSRLAEAGHEADRAAADATLATDRATATGADLAALRGRADATATDLACASAILTGLIPLAALADGWDSLSRDLTDREAARQAALAAQTRHATLDQHRTEAAGQLSLLEAADSRDQLARQALQDAAAALAAGITALEGGHPQDGLTDLTRLAATLTDLNRAGQNHATALQALTATTLLETAAEADGQAATVAIETAKAALARAEAAAAALTAPAEQANLAASEAARALRLHLQPGHPCPVCGAADHPSHSDSTLKALAIRLRHDLTRSHAEAATARTDQARATGDLAAATARAVQARQGLATQTGAAAQALATWTNDLQSARTQPHCPALPDLPLSSLAPQMQVIEAARLAAVVALSDLAALRARKDQNDAARHSLTAALETRVGTRRGLSQTLAQVAQDLALAAQTGQDALLRRDGLDRSLALFLTRADEPTGGLDLDAAALRLRLQAKVEGYRAARTRMEALQISLTRLQPDLATAEATHADAANQARRASDAAGQRALTRSTLQTGRDALLGGEATEAHRTRHNLTRLAGQTAKDTATQALAEAEAALGRTTGQHDGAAHSLTEAGATLTAAGVALEVALAGGDLRLADLSPLFALPRPEIEAARLALRRADDAVTAARSAVAARQSDLAQAVDAGLPDRSADDLTGALAQFDAALAARQERIGALNTELAADEATRARMSGLEGRIAVAEATAGVWAAVNAAIGSREGDKFARIAQSITLDQLVDHANHHLADLKPRYRLMRAGAGLATGGAGGLALQVLDLDMGSEARATRSLSGGERFLVSLALALALSRMGDTVGLAATLFIDEGFGSLDAETLDVAIDALETLQAQGRTIGVISHVEAMKERIPVQIRVQRLGGGRSTISIVGPGDCRT